MTKRTAGIFSLLLFDLASWIGIIVAFLNSIAAGVISVAAICTGVVLVLYSFCVKCSCRKECPHLLPGLATEWFPDRPSAPYSHGELTAMATGMLLIAGVPQVWLVDRMVWFTAYWLIMAAGVVIVRMRVCPGCKHLCCPVNLRRAAQDQDDGH